MLATLLGKIAGLFEKDFLFSSFLPALIFLMWVFLTGALTLGLEAVWFWIESRTTTQLGAIVFVATLLVVVLAYVLHALRGTFTYIWSGNSQCLMGLLTIGEYIQRRRFLRLRTNASRFSTWPDVQEDFRKQVSASWNIGQGKPSEKQVKALKHDAFSIRQTKDQDAVRLTTAKLAAAYALYKNETLCSVYEEAKRALMDHVEEERGQIQTEIQELDRKFGTLNTVKATALGNIIEACQQYPAKRYKAESDLLWPRLRQVIPADYRNSVEEPRILVDFALAMASLASVYSFVVLLGGPWIRYNLPLWIGLGVVSTLAAYFFYRLAVSAAYQHGELMRSAFDLFRLDLMDALGLPQPQNFYTEQKQWEEFSRLAVYGNAAANFPLKIRKAK